MTSFRLARKTPGFAFDVEFPLAAGTTAIFGLAGAGKSLLLEMAAGFVRPDSGRVLFEDTILFDAKAGVCVPACKRAFGYLAPSESLFPHLTLRENLRFAAHRFPRLDRHRRVADWLEKFELTAAAEQYPRQLSPLQTLNGSLARLFITEPKLLLLDGCDLSESLLLRVRSLTPAPILFATRDLDLCCAVAAQMVLIDEGRILQMGPPLDLLDRPASAAAARLLGMPNLFEGKIASLDPFRNSSLLQFEKFSLTAPYLPGHFKGDTISVAVRARDVRTHTAAVGANCISVPLVRTSYRSHFVRLEFGHNIFADLSPEGFAAQKTTKEWHVEIPAGALRFL